MLGCVFATCCCCKIVGGAGALGEGTRLFSGLYFGAKQGSSAHDDAGAVVRCPPCVEEGVPGEGASGDATAGRQGESQAESQGDVDEVEGLTGSGMAEAGAVEGAVEVPLAGAERAEALRGSQADAGLQGAWADSGVEGAVGAEGSAAKGGDASWTGLSGLAAKRLAAAATAGEESSSEVEMLQRVLPEVARATSWRNQESAGARMAGPGMAGPVWRGLHGGAGMGPKPRAMMACRLRAEMTSGS